MKSAQLSVRRENFCDLLKICKKCKTFLSLDFLLTVYSVVTCNVVINFVNVRTFRFCADTFVRPMYLCGYLLYRLSS